jgi:hypothetical protein
MSDQGSMDDEPLFSHLQKASDGKSALDYHAKLYHRCDRVIRKSGLYFRRFQWWFPWDVTRWWLPRWFEGGDEWCNVPVCAVIPPFGCFLVFCRPMRSMPCREDWMIMDDFTHADYSPCGFLYDGRLDHSRHHHSYLGRLCPAAREWLKTQPQ